MNKKGFSLVELLAVISILAILALIVSVPITKNIKEGNEKACESQFDTIIQAAKLWGNENKNLLPKEINGNSIVTLKTLKKEGFLPKKVENPVTNEEIDDSLIVNIKKIGNKCWEYSIDSQTIELYCLNVPIENQ